MTQEHMFDGVRVTDLHVDSQILTSQYHVFPGTTLTVCCLTLRNGFHVVGESACASPENFDAQIGRDLAYGDARRKIWALEGYLLRCTISQLAISQMALSQSLRPVPGDEVYGVREG